MYLDTLTQNLQQHDTVMSKKEIRGEVEIKRVVAPGQTKGWGRNVKETPSQLISWAGGVHLWCRPHGR
jgi:hypothetical protein